MDILRLFSPMVEVYSIDEAFIDLSHVPRSELERYGHLIRNTIKRWKDIPVGVGIGPNKLLAKYMNKHAKKNNGVCSAINNPELEALMKNSPVTDSWGVSRRIALRLRELASIKSVWQFKNAEVDWLMNNFSVVEIRLALELRGVFCLPLSREPKPKRNIMNSRSFGSLVMDYETIQVAVTHRATQGAVELRVHKLCAQALSVFVQTNPHRDDAPYVGEITVQFLTATDSTPKIIKAALQALRAVYKPGYQNVGVYLMNLVPEGVRQQLILEWQENTKDQVQMATMDSINTKMGRDTLRYGTEGFKQAWAMNRNHKSPNYLTDLKEVLEL